MFPKSLELVYLLSCHYHEMASSSIQKGQTFDDNVDSTDIHFQINEYFWFKYLLQILSDNREL